MVEEYLRIDEDGNVYCFHDSKFVKMLKIEEQKRLSHITPKNPFLKIIFKTLRWIFKDESKVAEWTRHWDCEWEVELILPTFKNRSDAINYEKEVITLLKLKNKL